MSSPLYDMLSKDCPSKDLTTQEKTEFIKMVKEVDTEDHQKMFILIRQHGLKTSDQPMFSLPYNAQKEGVSNLRFNLEELPFTLKQILYRFLKLHLSTQTLE